MTKEELEQAQQAPFEEWLDELDKDISFVQTMIAEFKNDNYIVHTPSIINKLKKLENDLLDIEKLMTGNLI